MAIRSKNWLQTRIGRDLSVRGRKRVTEYAYSAYQYLRDIIDSFLPVDSNNNITVGEITTTGDTPLLMEDTVWDDLQVSTGRISFPGVADPTWRQYNHGVGGGVTFDVLGFAVNDLIDFDIQTTHSMKLNTILDCHIHFILPNTTNIGDKFKFQLDVIAAGVDGTFAVPAGSPFSAEHTIVAGDNTNHRLLEICDIPAANTTVSTIYTCRLKRVAASANEYGSEVYLKYIDCHYQKDTLGSQGEFTK